MTMTKKTVDEIIEYKRSETGRKRHPGDVTKQLHNIGYAPINRLSELMGMDIESTCRWAYNIFLHHRMGSVGTMKCYLHVIPAEEFLMHLTEEEIIRMNKCCIASTCIANTGSWLQVPIPIIKEVWSHLQEDPHCYDEFIEEKYSHRRHLKAPLHLQGFETGWTYDPLGADLDPFDAEQISLEKVTSQGIDPRYADLIDPENPENKDLLD